MRARTLRIAWSQSSWVVALSWAGLSNSFDISAVALAFVAADAFDRWPESNGGCGSYSIDSWMALALASPPIWPASHSPRSMPAETPAQVTMRSSARTMRSSPTGCAPKARRACTAAQCEVARLPSSRPAAASSTEPEHTEAVQVVVSWVRRSQSRSRSSRACSIVENPPGTSTMSGAGVSSNECVAPMTSTPESAAIGPG